MDVTVVANGANVIGRRGENNATRMLFPISKWTQQYGNGGQFQLVAKRHGDAQPYPIAIESDDKYVYWLVGAADTEIVGNGTCELYYYINDVLAKSVIYTTRVFEAMDEPGEAPEPQASWVEQVHGYAADAAASSADAAASADASEASADAAARNADAAEASAEAAAESASYTAHPPIIGQNGNWWCWNGTEYEDSGEPSVGPQGERGDPGPRGDPGQPGDSAGFGTVSATVDDQTGTPGVTVTASGPDTAKNFAFSFTNLKGVKGDPGPQGPPGTVGEDTEAREMIAPIETSTTATQAHSLGECFSLNGVLYRALADIPIGGTITVGTNAVQTNIAQNFKRTVTLTSAQYAQLSSAEQNADIVYIISDDYSAPNVYTQGQVDSLLALKQDVLTFDTTPTAGSTNPVTSGGVKSALTAVENKLIFSNAGYHNSIYRGKYLGTAVTAEQYAAISAGTFDDLYIGDYWTIDGVNWRIAHFDYWLHKGDTECTTHHAVIVPDTNLVSAKMNNSNITTGGYVGSDFYTGNNSNTDRATAQNKVTSAFGSSHILTHREYLTNAVTNGYPSGGLWTDATMELMNEINVYGCFVFTSAINGTALPNKYTIDYPQFALFRLAPQHICIRSRWWLRDVVSSTHFACVAGDGHANYYTASNSYGVRPAFAIIA